VFEDSEKQTTKNVFWLFFWVSLATHFGLLIYWDWKSKNQPTLSEAPPLEVVDMRDLEKAHKLQPLNPKDQRIVETDKADQKKPEKDYFLGEQDQAVDQATRAKQIDDFRKKKGTGIGKNKTESANPTPEGAKENEETVENTVPMDAMDPQKKKAGVKKDWKTLSLQDLSVKGDGEETAASDDYLDDVIAGEKTILSTREFRYYSYYQRIKELLRQHWKPNVERKLALLWNKGHTIQQDELTTRLLVLLNRDGTVTKISRVGTSGVNDLDDAAMEAFQKAAPFPNPPQGMIDADGFVRIRWDFILKTDMGPSIQFRSAGNPPAGRY